MPLKTHQDEEPTLNLTPMIDVLFLLIIFFMAGTKFTDQESRLNLKLPQVAQEGALAPAPEKRVINVYQDGRISFDREFVTASRVETAVGGPATTIQRNGSGRAWRRGRAVSKRGIRIGNVP